MDKLNNFDFATKIVETICTKKKDQQIERYISFLTNVFEGIETQSIQYVANQALDLKRSGWKNEDVLEFVKRTRFSTKTAMTSQFGNGIKEFNYLCQVLFDEKDEEDVYYLWAIDDEEEVKSLKKFIDK